MRKIIITGSSGLIGKEVTSYFKKNNEVIECDLSLGHDLNDELFVKDFFKRNKANNLINLFALNHHISEGGGDNLFDISYALLLRAEFYLEDSMRFEMLYGIE